MHIDIYCFRDLMTDLYLELFASWEAGNACHIRLRLPFSNTAAISHLILVGHHIYGVWLYRITDIYSSQYIYMTDTQSEIPYKYRNFANPQLVVLTTHVCLGRSLGHGLTLLI